MSLPKMITIDETVGYEDENEFFNSGVVRRIQKCKSHACIELDAVFEVMLTNSIVFTIETNGKMVEVKGKDVVSL